MIRIRAEENAVLLWNRETAGTAFLSGPELCVLERWAVTGHVNGFIGRLKALGFIHDALRQEAAAAITSCRKKKAPLNAFCAPESLHIELTGYCPLQCPQCYKAGSEKTELSLPYIQDLLSQAESAGVFQIALGGGEPLTYAHLEETAALAKAGGMSCSVTTSGAGLDENRLNRLRAAGIDHIQISLNGSTEKINRLSRNGYSEALAALEMLSKANLSFGINWVARKDNLHDLPNMLNLAKRMAAGNLNILRYKPSVQEDYARNCLSMEEQRLLADMVRRSRGVAIKVDSAYSGLLCALNKRAGYLSGCGAGRRFLAVDAAGRFRPCSHLDLAEAGGDLLEYWYHSAHLADFRRIGPQEEACTGPPAQLSDIGRQKEMSETARCMQCTYRRGCRGCRAITEHAVSVGCAYFAPNGFEGD